MIDLYLRDVVAVSDLSADLALLDAAELAKAARFRRLADRLLYVQAHAFLRRVLSRYADVRPESWRFELGAHGKPRLCTVTHPDLLELCFNLSHCSDAFAVVVTTKFAVGVDLERVDALGDWHFIADMILSPSEHALCRTTCADQIDVRRFLISRWTRKEALLKALGLGLGIVEPPEISLLDHPDGSTTISLKPGLNSVESLWPATWQLHAGSQDGLHYWAVACPDSTDSVINFRHIE